MYPSKPWCATLPPHPHTTRLAYQLIEPQKVDIISTKAIAALADHPPLAMDPALADVVVAAGATLVLVVLTPIPDVVINGAAEVVVMLPTPLAADVILVLIPLVFVLVESGPSGSGRLSGASCFSGCSVPLLSVS